MEAIWMKKSHRRKLKWFIVAFCVIAVPIVLMFGFILIANEDLYGRAIDTQTAVGVGRGRTAPAAASALEMIVIGVPLIALGIAVGISFIRGRLSDHGQKEQPGSNDNT